MPSSDQIASASSSLLVADLGREREAPGGVDAAAPGREDAEPPVADLVAEALDDDRLVGGDDPGRRLLLLQVVDEVLGGELVEVVVLRQLLRVGVDRLAARRRRSPCRARPGGRCRRRARRGPRPGRPGAGVTITRSRVISWIRQVVAPSRKVWPGPRLVDHLLVELADPAAVGQVDAVEAAVGDRARVGDRQLPRPRAAAHLALGAVPDDPRAQLGEALGGVAPVEHVEHVLELLAGELAEGLGRV